MTGRVAAFFHRLKAKERDWRHSYGTDISTPEARRRAQFHFNYFDHAILRVHWHNFHRIAEGVFRANQPSPSRLQQFRDMGITTILNLRGASEHSQYLFEKEACAALGLRLIDHRLYASDLASRQELLGLLKIFDTIERPVVMHCKSGSDRTGFASILYLNIYCGMPISKARRELNWRYFHLRHSKNGILDVFFDAYVEDNAKTPISMRDWIANTYDQDALRQRFQAGRRWFG